VLYYEEITDKIIAAAVEVHKALGPGLLESAYAKCMCHELSLRQLEFASEVDLPVSYKGVNLDCGYRMAIVVANKVVLELKAVSQLLPVHEAQLMTYLKLSGMKVGLLINFNVPLLTKGIVRRVL
jgi:GxxExxY protein